MLKGPLFYKQKPDTGRKGKESMLFTKAIAPNTREEEQARRAAGGETEKPRISAASPPNSMSSLLWKNYILENTQENSEN